jgi:amidase
MSLSLAIPSRTQGSTGNVYFTQLASAQLLRLQNQIPPTYRLPESLLVNPQLDLTSISETCGGLSKKEIIITDLDATEVLEKMKSSELTAFWKRAAAIAHQLTACLTNFFLDEGIQRAKELDDLKAHGTTVSTLHGLPISIMVRICYGTLLLAST